MVHTKQLLPSFQSTVTTSLPIGSGIPNYIPARTCHNSIPAHTCHNFIPVWPHPAWNLTQSLYRVHTQSPLGGGVGSGVWFVYTWQRLFCIPIKRRFKGGYMPTHACINSIPGWPHPAGYLTLACCTEYILNHHLAEGCRVGVWGCTYLAKTLPYSDRKRIRRWGINYIPTHTCHISIPVWTCLAGYLTFFLYWVHTLQCYLAEE